MPVTLTPMTPDDRVPVIDIFNHYVEHSFAAYHEIPVAYEFFDTFLGMSRGLPTAVARDDAGAVVGFGLLRPYNAMSAFARTAELTYFLHPEWTGRGVGGQMLDHLLDAGRAQGLTTVLASISSLNEGSLRFHAKHGFTECGRLVGVGRKHGRTFDVVYCQRSLA